MRDKRGRFVKGHFGFIGKHSEETKKKISKAVKNRKPTQKQLETLKLGRIKKWTEGMKKNLGKHKNHAKGEKHYLWKGQKVSYFALHHWVIKNLGKAEKCKFCNIQEVKRKDGRNGLDWANKSGYYKRKLDDWIPLCKSCHKVYDKFNQDERRTLQFLKKSVD